MDKIESRTGMRALITLIASALLLGLAGCSGNDAETMTAAEIDKLIAPVGQLNTGAPITTETPAAAPADAPASTPAPVEAPASTPATPVPATPAPVAAARSGKQVYDTSCFACHAIGAAGAPKFGDKAAWAPRIAQGMDTLVTHALNGFQGATGVMPPRGTCANCSDDEMKAAITYMVDNAK